MKRDYISKNVIRRLPRYVRKLDDLAKAGIERISSGEMGKQMGLTPSQIRQDFSCFGEFGQQGYGYNVKALREEICNILGINKRYSVILIGVGKIGQSLIENFDFARFGYDFKCAFEIRKELVGQEIAGYPILDRDIQDAYIKENNIDIAILSVGKEAAQRVANTLVDSGIKGIWNFTDVDIEVSDPSVIVENIHFSDSLLVLGYFMNSRDMENEE
ncbi:MAG: redox-sensing transcriptional repressor Rex [Oscillospiraceae bacterium]|nr:redox-sensing transcriptional repressor Rex [Oscillospiraceae bacterium]